MGGNDPIIIEIGLNGPTMKDVNPNVPRTPDEIVEDAFRCVDAGAAIVHNHNDELAVGSVDGVHSPDPYIEIWRRILDKHPDVMLYPTKAGGGPHTTIEKRYAHVLALADAGVLGMALFDPGSTNFAVLQEDGLPKPVNDNYLNDSADTRYMFDKCKDRELPLSISIFEPGWLRVTLAYHEARGLPAGSLLKFYFGGERRMRVGMPPTKPSLEAYLDMIKGTDLPWLAAVQGGDVVGCGLAQLVLERGGHLRVGIEDYDGPGTPTNVELMNQLVELAESAGRKPATPKQAREILGFK